MCYIAVPSEPLLPARPLIAVSVAPRLLADALALVLEGAGLAVVCPPAPEGTQAFDLAIVSDSLASHVVAETVITLPVGGLATVRLGADSAEDRVHVAGLDDMVALVRRCLADRRFTQPAL